MPSVRVLQSNVQADVVGFVRCWNDSAPLISARLPAGVNPVALIDVNDTERAQMMVRSANLRSYGYDTSDEPNGLAVAGILQVFHPHDFRGDIRVTMAAIRKRQNEDLTVLRPRFRRTLLGCLKLMAEEAAALPFPVRIIAEYPDVSGGDDGGPVTLRKFLTEMAQRNGRTGHATGGFVRWDGDDALTPQDVLTGLNGLVTG